MHWHAVGQRNDSGEMDIRNESHVDDSLLGCKANGINPCIPSGLKTWESEHPGGKEAATVACIVTERRGNGVIIKVHIPSDSHFSGGNRFLGGLSRSNWQ